MKAYQPLSTSSESGMETECTFYESTGEKYTFIYPPDSFGHVSFLNISRDGQFIVALGNDVAHPQDKPATRLLVWNVDSQELVLNQLQPLELNRVEFSLDGSLLAAYLCHGTKRYSDEFRDVAVVLDSATGQERSVLKYNDELDDLYWMPNYIKGAVSPDGQRLLTLHGKRPVGSGGAVAQGRLLDVESGREILAMPVADVNVFNWDLVFDPTGNQLTSLLPGKASGTGGGGQSVVYDATPLSPEQDAQLITRRLLEALQKETPLPSEMVIEIEARKRRRHKDMMISPESQSGMLANPTESCSNSWDIVHGFG